MNKTIGVLAHVDAGKTTFSEGLLYHTRSIKKRGRVDHKNSYLDNHEIEKERGITLFSDQAIMKYKGDTYYLIDTPGHIDFSPEMERAIKVMDYAVVIVSAVEGVQGHTETVWQLLKKHKIPTFFFINKTDRIGANINNVMDEIKVNLSENTCYIASSLEEDLSEEVIEFIAERDEYLLELYLEGKYNKALWIKHMRKMIKESRIYISTGGSALQDEGILEFLDILHELTETDYRNEEFKGVIYKIGHDKRGNKITYIKILSGHIKVRDEIGYKCEEKLREKITEIRLYHGGKYSAIDEARAGQIVGVIGLSKTMAGQGLGNIDLDIDYNMIPALKSKVIFSPSVNIKELVQAFKILNEEDPSLKVTWEEELQELHIHVMGLIQLEILEKVVKDRFGFPVEFGAPSIIYKETIDGEVRGYGHFEPLGHYAEVHLKIEAGDRNSGIEYENLCHTDNLSKGNQNLVKHHIYEREHRGLLTGSTLTDVKISLITGRGHNKHTSGGDFRQATYRALRQGLEKAKKVLLEPYYDFKIKVNLDYMGKVLSDIQRASGVFETPKTIGDKVIIVGRGPVATLMDYPMELVAFTSGKGIIKLVYGGYDLCHNQEEVIERINYNKNADKEYSSSSIFCSKGQAYIVPWNRVEEEMHCL